MHPRNLSLSLCIFPCFTESSLTLFLSVLFIHFY
jgi:hypothetical protein